MNVIQEYLDGVRIRYPEYHQAITDISSKILRDLSGVSVIVLIPVHVSEKNISRLLSHYSSQSIGVETFEIVLFVNRSGQDVSFEEIRQSIDTFKTEHSLRISCFEHTFEKRVPIGLLRKIINDVAIVRGVMETTLLVNNDADALHIDKNYLKELLELHEGRTLLTTQSQQYLDEVYSMPIFGDVVRFIRALDDAYGDMRFPDAFLSAWCGNFVLNAGAYAQVGGFDSAAWVGEELVLCHFFVQKFGGGAFVRTAPRIVTSCRRMAHGFLKHVVAGEDYRDFFTADIRHTAEEEFLARVGGVAEKGSIEDVLRRAGEEFSFYLEKLNITIRGDDPESDERRFRCAFSIINEALHCIGGSVVLNQSDNQGQIVFKKGSTVLMKKLEPVAGAVHGDNNQR